MGLRSIAYVPHLQRFLTRSLGLSALIERIPLVHGHYFNFGRFEVRVDGNLVEVRQFDMLPTRAFCAARRGNYEGVFRTMGYQGRVTEATWGTMGHGACTFRIDLSGTSPRVSRAGRARAEKPYGSSRHGGER